MLETKSIWAFFRGGSEYLHNELCWGWNPNLNTKSIHVSYTPCTCRLTVILYNVLNNFVHEGWMQWLTPVIPATQEAEAGESLELRRQRLQ